MKNTGLHHKCEHVATGASTSGFTAREGKTVSNTGCLSMCEELCEGQGRSHGLPHGSAAKQAPSLPLFTEAEAQRG